MVKSRATVWSMLTHALTASSSRVSYDERATPAPGACVQMDVPVEPAAEAAEAAVAEGEREAKRPCLEPCAPRLGKKRKVVIFLGYVGAGYAGMQRNPGVRSIEDGA